MSKTVFDSAMCAHVWAQQTQQSGRNANGSMYFTGPTIYSYGAHYPIATIAHGATWFNSNTSSMTTNGKHKPAVRRAIKGAFHHVPNLHKLLPMLSSVKPDKAAIAQYLADNWECFPPQSPIAAKLLTIAGSRKKWATMHKAQADKQSRDNAKAAKQERAAAIATCKQLAAMSHDALRHYVASAIGTTPYTQASNAKRCIAAMRKAHKLAGDGPWRKGAWAAIKQSSAIVDSLLGQINRHKAMRAAIRTLRQSPPAPIDTQQYALTILCNAGHMPAATRAKAQAGIAYLSLQIEQERAARAQAARLAREAIRAAWLAGEGYSSCGLTDGQGGALIRIKGDELQTSKGATVPLDHALRALAFVRAVKARGIDWQRKDTGPRVGHFTIDKIFANGDFIAGCHRINWVEQERLAATGGY